MWFAAAPKHTQAHLEPDLLTPNGCAHAWMLFSAFCGQRVEKIPSDKGVCMLSTRKHARVRARAPVIRVVCEGYSNNFQRSEVRVQPGSRLDQDFKLTCLGPTTWVCPYKDTRDPPGSRAEEDYQLPSRKPGRGGRKQTRRWGWEGSEARASVQNRYRLYLGPGLWCNDS